MEITKEPVFNTQTAPDAAIFRIAALIFLVNTLKYYCKKLPCTTKKSLRIVGNSR